LYIHLKYIDPATTNDFPEDYLEIVKNTHEKGGFGSIG